MVLDYVLAQIDIPKFVYDTPFLFVVTLNGCLDFYAAQEISHPGVVTRFDLKHPVVGGGFFYRTNDEMLILAGSSGTYGAISQHAADKFGKLLLAELIRRNISLHGYLAEPNKSPVNFDWDSILS